MTSTHGIEPVSPRAVPQLRIELEAVARNTRMLADRSGRPVMAVVKANGFGVGAVDSARTALANGADGVGVTSIAEALELRDAGVDAPILSWLNPVEADFATAIAHDVDLVVPSLEHLDAVTKATDTARRVARIHLHVDVGMYRDGAPRADWPDLFESAVARQSHGAVVVIGVMGHLGHGETPADPLNAIGKAAYAEALAMAEQCGIRPQIRHLAATAATLNDRQTHYDTCRVGAGLAGIDPSGSVQLHQPFTLTAPIVSIRDVPAGAFVGYGRTYQTSRPSRLAQLPLGYADGLAMQASGRAEVLINGSRRRIVGRISMDQAVVDLGDALAQPGDPAIVFGPGADGEPTVAQWAEWADTLPHAIVTGIGERVRRVVVPAGGEQ